MRHLVLAACLAGCGTTAPQPSAESPPPRSPRATSEEPEFGDAWLALELSEEVLALLQSELLEVQRGLGDLVLPNASSRAWFAERVTVRDVASLGTFGPSDLPARYGVEEAPVSFAPEATVSREELDLLRPILGRLFTVDDARVAAKRGRFLGEGNDHYEIDVGLSFVGTEPDGAVLEASGMARARARLEAPAAVGQRARWRFTHFEVEDLRVRRRQAGRVFVDVVPERLPPELAREARRSRHEELVDAFFSDRMGFSIPHAHFDPVSHDRHPALAVVDIEGDGLDELYVMGRWGRNLLLAQQADGSFVDRAPDLGLDLEDHSSAALFADFDNDGDVDAFVGRTLAPSVLLLQEDGRFLVHDAGMPLPRLVSGLAAADVDGDGLLDLHVATYSKKAAGGIAPELWPGDEATLTALLAQDPYLDSGGPRNLLLRNLGGGRFVDSASDAGVQAFRQTFQGTFADVDGDRDPDLYLANDFAPNTLYLNRGDGTFEDATDAWGGTDQGFGMGASFGDVDGDGDVDLYVSNMYSKAGERVLAALPDVDPRFAAMARGNSLLRNDGGRFTRISGRTSDTAEVEASGWSWSGLMRDVDSDGWLDVAVLNGYFTPPRRHALPVDI